MRHSADATDMPVAGFVATGLGGFEAAALELIREGDVPAAQLCVSKGGRVVLSRAYGWLDPVKRTPLPTNARIGLASLDKVVTSTAIDLLCKARAHIPGTHEVLSHDLRPFVVFRSLGLGPADGSLVDHRLLEITVDHLLKHQAGLDQTVHDARAVQSVLKMSTPPTPRDSIRFFFRTSLDRDVGAGSSYNSAGYFVLRFLVDMIGHGFIPYLKKNVFGPAGTSDICLSHARVADRDPLEVRYKCSGCGPSIFPEDRGRVIPEIEGGNGRYVDSHLVLATSAEAVVKYLSYWVFGSGDRLWSESPAALAPGLNDGWGVYNGGMVGVRTTMVQRRWTMCNYALLMNWAGDRPGVKISDMAARLTMEAERLGW